MLLPEMSGWKLCMIPKWVKAKDVAWLRVSCGTIRRKKGRAIPSVYPSLRIVLSQQQREQFYRLLEKFIQKNLKSIVAKSA